MSAHLSFIPFYPGEPRSMPVEKLKEQQLELPGLKLLRQCLGSSVGGVGCALCQRDTIDRFLRSKSAWLNDDRVNLMADVCPECVTRRIASIVHLQDVVGNLSIRQKLAKESRQGFGGNYHNRNST